MGQDSSYTRDADQFQCSKPVSDSTVLLDAAGFIEVRGYAVPHSDHGPVVRVQVSDGEGRSWTDAEIDDRGTEGSKWS